MWLMGVSVVACKRTTVKYYYRVCASSRGSGYSEISRAQVGGTTSDFFRCWGQCGQDLVSWPRPCAEFAFPPSGPAVTGQGSGIQMRLTVRAKGVLHGARSHETVSGGTVPPIELGFI